MSAAHTVCRYVVPKGPHGAPGYELQGTSSYSALEAWNQACAALSLLPLPFHHIQSLPFISTTRAAYQAPFTVF